MSRGEIESREGFMGATGSRLLVYGKDGRLQLSAGTDHVAAYDWQAGDGGPVLAGGRRVSATGRAGLTVKAALNIARR